MMESLGEHLKRERELRDISIDDIASATKINKNYIEAIERDDFDHLPGRAFVIGFLKNYAAYIGLDEEEVVTRFLDFTSEEGNSSIKEKNTTVEIETNETEENKIKKSSFLGWIFISLIIITILGLTYYFLNR